MNVEVYVEWLTRQKYRIKKTASSYWFNAGPCAFEAIPLHKLIEPSEEELNSIFKDPRTLAVRYSKPVSAQYGKVSYHVVARAPYDIDLFRSHGRNTLRKAIANCDIKVEQISFERLATEGWNLQRETLERQCRSKSMSQEQWELCCRSAEGLPGFEAWASIMDNKLTATVFTLQVDDVCTIPYAQSLSEYRGCYVNNVLFYNVCKEFLSRPGVNEVFTNLQSLDAPESVDEFKFRMSFVPKPVRQQIVFNPLVQPFVNDRTHEVIKRVLDRKADPFLAKVEGMVRFYLEGEKPRNLQAVPECLLEGY